MRVSELASRAGTTAKTIRFYEAEGVLPAAPRAGNGYRDYGDEDLCRVRLVVPMRGLWLDLAESGRLAGLCSAGRCEEMSADFARRLAERRASVAAAMTELRHLDAELAVLERTLASDEPQATFCLGSEAITTEPTHDQLRHHAGR